jgi:hypothetical protein
MNTYRETEMKILVIPDTQVKPGCSVEHLGWVGKYIVDKQPEVIVHLGDHWDMESLSSYDKGTKRAEGKRVQADIQAGNYAMDDLLRPLRQLQKRQYINKKKIYRPRLVFTLGNHENRIERAVNEDAKLDGLLSYKALNLRDWEVHDFLEPVVIEGVAFCHYFTSGVMGRPVTSAKAMLTKKMMSTVMGHVQDRDIAYAKRADGNYLTGLFAGICYTHDEAYLNPQTNGSWRGVWMLNEVQDGHFDEMPVSLRFLKERYG